MNYDHDDIEARELAEEAAFERRYLQRLAAHPSCRDPEHPGCDRCEDDPDHPDGK